MRTIVYGQAVIDSGEPVACELRVTCERIDVSTNLPKPNPNWSMVDGAGHFHAAWRDGRRVEYPTLRSESRPCDGACGDPTHMERYYVCRICGVQIAPGTTPGPHYESATGPEDWECVVAAELPLNTDVSIRVTAGGDTEWFGVARVIGCTIPVGEAQPLARLAGVSALGRRKVTP